MPLLDIAVRHDDLLQRIDPVNDRFELARLDQSFEHEQVFELIATVDLPMSSAVTRHERIRLLRRHGGAAAQHDDSHPCRPYHHTRPENHKHGLC